VIYAKGRAVDDLHQARAGGYGLLLSHCFRRGDGYVFTRASITSHSMTEMPDACEHHGDAVLVGGLDHFLVAH
jgi:hypothetical protein